MPQDGEIDLKEVKAKYSLGDITLVDSREINYANEARLYFEISLAIGLMLLGSVITEYNQTYLVVAIIFIGFGLINLVRYILKTNKLDTTTKSPVDNGLNKNLQDIINETED